MAWTPARLSAQHLLRAALLLLAALHPAGTLLLALRLRADTLPAAHLAGLFLALRHLVPLLPLLLLPPVQ